MDKLTELTYDWDEGRAVEDLTAKINEIIRVVNWLLDQDPTCCDNGKFGDGHKCQKQEDNQ